jgi:signal transduction histidine kinase
LRERAEEKQREQVKFIAMVAHELRNPLSPIRTAADLLKRVRLDAPTVGSLQRVIERQVQHMAHLIEDLLEGSRGTTGKFRLLFTEVDLGEVINSAIDACRSAMESRHQQLDFEFPTERLVVLGDEVRLFQVFSNLLDNASKYTPERGHVWLSVTREFESVMVSVADDGIGLSPEALPHVFELFVQDERAIRVHSAGLGIGLAVVNELVTSHGGTVVAKSAGPGEGSEFTVTLPLYRSR